MKLILVVLISVISGYAATDIETQITLRYFQWSVNDTYHTNINDAVRLLYFPGFDLNKMTIFYFHGYLETMDWESVQTIIHAYLHRGDHNLVIVDWTKLSTSPYLFNAAPNAIRVGRALSRAIETLVYETGMKPALVHIVGHSLGGQSAGFAGKYLPFKVNRISCLDAAEPGFYGLGIHVNETDAEFVDAIHTDAGIYGARFSTATVDFWPNGGMRPQPGCFPIPLIPYPLSDTDSCSHWRSWRLWAESLLNEEAFPARKCKVNYYKTGLKRIEYDFEDSTIVYMGYAASRWLRGNYCLVTRSTAPFGYGNTLDYNTLAAV